MTTARASQQEEAAFEREARQDRPDDVYNPVDIAADGRSLAENGTLTDLKKASPGPARPRKYSHGFFDSELAPLRKIYLKIVISAAMLTIVIMWACLPLYWGSLWKAPEYAYRLKTFVVDFDNDSAVSQAVIAATRASLEGPAPHLGYEFVEAGRFADISQVANAVHQEEAWAAIVIRSGVAERLLQARQTGDATYSSTSAVVAIYNQGRNELAAGNYIVPAFSSVLGPALARASAQSAADYIEANVGNATALALLTQAPSTIVGYAYSLDNLHPYNVPVATAVTLVGLIYLLILAFIQTMAHFGAREIVAPWLTNKAYLTLRCVVPLLVYMPVSFMFSMINLAFQVPFGQGPFTAAGGFFLTAFLFYLGMAALGLATEFFITILTPKFIAFFLVAWIILNVSEVVLPIELSGSVIYRVGNGLPFHALSQALRTILFGTANRIARSCGILLGWICLSLITIPLITWIMRRKDVKREAAARAEASNGSVSEKRV